MSFPISPINGQTAVLNGITYAYSTSTTAWERLQSTVTATTTLLITGTTSATSTTTGALIVAGGVGIQGSLYVANTSYIGGAQIITTATIAQYASTATGVATTASFANTATTISISTASSASPYYLTFVSTTSGNLSVLNDAGGRLTFAPASGQLNVPNVNITSSTVSIGTQSGALQVQGGAGIGGNLNVGGNIYSNGVQLVPTAIQEITATQGQTLFTVTGGYTVGTVVVVANGVELGNSDVTAANGSCMNKMLE